MTGYAGRQTGGLDIFKQTTPHRQYAPKSACIALGIFAGIVAGSGLGGIDAVAQSYPAKPIKILVGYGPGGATDVTARVVAQKLAENMR